MPYTLHLVWPQTPSNYLLILGKYKKQVPLHLKSKFRSSKADKMSIRDDSLFIQLKCPVWGKGSNQLIQASIDFYAKWPMFGVTFVQERGQISWKVTTFWKEHLSIFCLRQFFQGGHLRFWPFFWPRSWKGSKTLAKKLNLGKWSALK